MVRPRRRKNSSPIKRSCRATKPGNSRMATGSRFVRRGACRQRHGSRHAAAAGLGIAWLPDCVIHDYGRRCACSGRDALSATFGRGLGVIRPPGQHPARKVRVLTELLIESRTGSASSPFRLRGISKPDAKSQKSGAKTTRLTGIRSRLRQSDQRRFSTFFSRTTTSMRATS